MPRHHPQGGGHVRGIDLRHEIAIGEDHHREGALGNHHRQGNNQQFAQRLTIKM